MATSLNHCLIYQTKGSTGIKSAWSKTPKNRLCWPGVLMPGDSCFNPAVCDLDRGFHITAQDRSGQSELVWKRRISVGIIGDIKGRTDSDLADYMMIMESAVCTPGHWQAGSARCSWFVPPLRFSPFSAFWDSP